MQSVYIFDIMTLKNVHCCTQGGTLMPLVSMKEMLIDAKETVMRLVNTILITSNLHKLF